MRRHRGVPAAGRAEHLELGLGRHRHLQDLGMAHAATAPQLVEVARRSPRSTPAPPEIPSHDALIRPDEHVAAVDRGDRERRRIGRAVHDQRLRVGLEVAQDRVHLHEPAPRLEVQLALGRARRARIHRDDAVRDRRVHEEREPDRDPELRPQLLRQHEVLEPQRAAPGRPELRVARPQRPAALAHAHDLALVQVEHVPVVGGHGRVAEVAAFVRARPAPGGFGCASPRSPETISARRRFATASSSGFTAPP